VAIENVFELPRNALCIAQFVTAFQCREVTLVQLAAIGPFVTAWDAPALKDVYFSPICLEDQRFVFERCERRGDFLNVMLLAFFSACEGSALLDSKRRMFIGNLESQVENCIHALHGCYEEMLTTPGRITHQVPLYYTGADQ